MSIFRTITWILLLNVFALGGQAFSAPNLEAPPESPNSGFRFEGVNGTVYAMCEWNGSIVVGGEFTQAGNVVVSNIARWDTFGWSALGSGTGPVRALAAYNGDLFAGLDVSGSASIVRWDGSFWAAVGTAPDKAVYALAVYGGSLIAGGRFQNPANRIARWNGTTWSPLGSGCDGDVYALSEFGGSLVAGGGFGHAGGAAAERIARWDGSSWYPYGAGFSGNVLAVMPYAGSLVAAGEFSRSGQVTLNRIARWDGSAWAPLGSGTSSRVRALEVYNNDLIVGGEFISAGGIPASHIAKWDGVSWGPLGSGLNQYVWSLKSWDADLVAGGAFTQAGGASANHIAVWDGSTWLPLTSIGACCLPTGACLVSGSDSCVALGGAYMGRDTVCDPDPCASAPGACCLPDGSCQTVTRRQCLTLCGVFSGISLGCAPNPCASSEGACCTPDGHCSLRNPLQCAGLGGEFQGVNTICSPNPCVTVPDTDVTFLLVDQESTPIPGSQFCVAGIYVQQGERIRLPAGRRYATLYPGINGQAQITSLSRFDSLSVSGAPMQTATFVWKEADLSCDMIDQDGVRIPASQWRWSTSPPLPTGASIRLPVTEDPETPHLAGGYAGGYGITLYPGLNTRAQTDLLGWSEDGELLPDSDPKVRVWRSAKGTLHIVDVQGSEVEGSQYLIAQNVGEGFTGDPLLLPVTDDPSVPPIGGLFAGGYQIWVRPFVDGPMQSFTFELHEDLSFTPALVEIDGEQFGLRLNLPSPAARTHVVKVDGTGDFPTIAGALAASSPGDTIRVMEGIYTWPSQTGSPLDFAGKDVVLVSHGGPNMTILDFAAGAGQIRFSGGESYEAVLDGFTLRNGAYSGAEGALRINGASPTIRNCVISGHRAVSEGSAIVVLANGGPRFINCTVSGSSGGQRGGGIYLAANTTARLEHCVLWGNCKGGIQQNYYSNGGTIWFNTCVVNTDGGHGSGQIIFEGGNSTLDPEFCAPASCSDAPTAAGVYTVTQGSPCLLPDGFRLIGALGEGCGPQAVWDGSGDGLHWSDPSNWLGNVVPTVDSYVLITMAGAYTVLLDGNTRVRHLELGTHQGPQELRVQGAELVLGRGGINRTRVTVTSGARLRLEETSDPSVSFLNEGELVLEGGDASGGSRVENHGVIRKATSSEGSLTAAVVNETGAFILVDAGLLHLTGSLEHSGGLVVSVDAVLDLGSGVDPVTCSAPSSIAVQGGSIIGTRGLATSGRLDCSASAPSRNVLSVPIVLDESGQFSVVSGELDLTRQMECLGTIELQPGSTLRLDPSIQGEKLEIMETGIFHLSSTQVLGPGEISNLGSVIQSDATTSQIMTKLTNYRELNPALEGRVLLESGGLTVQRLSNSGLVTIPSLATLTVTDTLRNNASGILEGSGTLDVMSCVFRDDGWIRPGGDGGTGILHILGEVDQSPTATIDGEIAGKVAGTEFDQLLCRGGRFRGRLDIRLINGYTPALGDSFVVLEVEYASLQGVPDVRVEGLDCVSGLEGPPGIYLNPLVDAQRILLVATNDPGSNQHPVLGDDSATTDWLTPRDLRILDNDGDQDGDPLRVVRLETAGTSGQTTLLPGDSVIFYSPPVSFVGADTFSYIATDCRGLNDTARVVVQVSCPPQITLRVPSEYPTIQSAIQVAVSSDTILVAPGIYEGTGNVGLDFLGKGLVVRSEAGAEFTILECGGSNPGVLFHSGETTASVLQGLTIRNAGQPGVAGAAVRVESSSPRLQDCIFHGNFAERGGAVAVTNGSVHLVGCTVANNRASVVGGAFYGDNVSAIYLERSVLWDNCAPGVGDDFWTDGSITFQCCAVDSALDGAVQVNYEGENSFVSPMFCKAADCDSTPQSTGQYHVDASSWCVANNNPCGQRIGAMGSQCAAYSGLGMEDSGIPLQLMMDNPAPNPASDEVRLRLGLPRAGEVRVCLYDVSGRLVREVLNRELPAGFYILTWNLAGGGHNGDVKSGAYFLQLRYGHQRRVSPLIVIR